MLLSKRAHVRIPLSQLHKRLTKQVTQNRRTVTTWPSTFTPQHIETIKLRIRKNPRVTLSRKKFAESRRAGVLVPLLNHNGKASILYTKRISTLRSHAGEVSFPGGVEDAQDNGDLIVTALRETEEEVGIKRETVEVLGLFDEALSLHQLIVTPVIGFLGNYSGDINQSIKINPSEIEDVFTVPLDDLLGEGCKVMEQLNRGTVARFIKAPYPIWGLTAYITDLCLRKLLTNLDQSS